VSTGAALIPEGLEKSVSVEERAEGSPVGPSQEGPQVRGNDPAQLPGGHQ